MERKKLEEELDFVEKSKNADVIIKPANRNVKNKYTQTYRIIKTVLLVFAWISLGINIEISSPTFEDLKIYLDTNYEKLSGLFSLKNTAYLIIVVFGGFILDKFSNYADLILALSSAFLALPNLMIAFSRNYWLALAVLFVQGLAHACYDISGNHIILSLWRGISDSPINAMHAGYGIGAVLAVQFAKHFITFNDQKNVDVSNSTILETTNNSSNITMSNSVDEDLMSRVTNCIRVTFSVSFVVGFLISAAFVVTQIYEMRLRRAERKQVEETELHNLQLNKSEEKEEKSENEASSDDKIAQIKHFLQKLFFGEKSYHGKALFYMVIQILLISFIEFHLQGHITVVGKFTTTYFKNSPANLSSNDYSLILTLFWALFVVSRFFAAFVAFKLNPLVFLFALITANLLANSLFLIPQLTYSKTFFLVCMSFMGFASGPAIPSTFMAAKTILNDYNSFVLSIFMVGLGLSGIVYQQLTGELLAFVKPRENFLGFEQFQPSYIIAYVLFTASALAFACLLLSLLIYKRYSHLVRQ